MPATEKVVGVVQTARPVVERLAKDEEFQQHVRSAYDSARVLYDELFVDRAPNSIKSKIARDVTVQTELKRVLAELGAATKRAKTPPKTSHKGRNTLLLAGILIGILYNPATGSDTRRWLKEKAFGPEETFEYEP